VANTFIFANNAGSTFAGSISNTALSLNLQAGGGALFPNPTTGQVFQITAIDAATGLLREIMQCTARSADTLTVVRAQEGTTALAWNAGDLVQELWTAGQAGAMVQLGQAGTIFVPVVTQTTFFVDNALGSNSFDGTSATVVAGTNHGPWGTIQFGVNTLSGFSFGGQTVTLQLGTTGTYAGPVNIGVPLGGTLVIQGNPSNQSSYTISGNPSSSGATGLVGINGGSVQLSGLTLANAGSAGSANAIVAGANLEVDHITFAGSAADGNHLVASSSSLIIINSGCIWALGGISGIFCLDGGVVNQFANATTSGTPAFSQAFCVAENCGIFSFGGSGGFTFTNTGATGPRFLASANGVINTNGSGVNYFPGSTAGTETNGGQYL
jgi:hypothetical protein